MESDDQTALKMTLGNLILNNLRMISDQLLTGLILKLTFFKVMYQDLVTSIGTKSSSPQVSSFIFKEVVFLVFSQLLYHNYL